MSRVTVRFVAFALAAAMALPMPADERRPAPAEARCATMEVFVTGDAELSRAAREAITTDYADRKGLRVTFHDVAASEQALDRYWELIDHYKVAKPGLPAVHVSGQFEVGWDSKRTPERLKQALTVEVFTRQGCPRCRDAHPVLFERLAARYPAYEFVERDTARSAEAAKRFQEVAQQHRVQAASVPAVHMCRKFLVGFQNAETSFRQWDAVLKEATIECPPEPAPGKETSGQRTSRSDSRSSTWTPPLLWAVGLAIAQSETGAEPPVDLERATPVSEPESDAPPPRRRPPPETAGDSERQEARAPTSADAPDVVTVPWLGDIRWRDWGMPAFTLAVGLIDGFNPCAMWVLLFLLSVLVNLRDRWKILAVAGTFVVISGLAYLAFMAAWLNLFQLVSLVRPAQIALGLLGIGIGSIHIKDFFAFHKGVSLSIPESAKPRLYERVRRIVGARTLWAAILGASVLAVLVNIVELLCTAGLPAMYTGILTLQDYPVWKNYAFLLLYILGYMFDDALMVSVVVVTLGRHKLQERGGRILKLISGGVILTLGVLMLFKPEWLV
ncbi:MAG: hypothetical protein KF774_19340 [Planctomyces sp.]|nr:hypothetical protein [Planctomyces sp.]